MKGISASFRLVEVKDLLSLCSCLLGVMVAAIATLFTPRANAQDAPSTNHDYWAVEDAAARAKLPPYKIIPAVTSGELTPANGYPKRETFLTWHRSHGDNGGIRYSAL